MNALGLAALALLALGPHCASAVAAADAALLRGVADEPRAFGYQVGDVVRRTLSVEVPEGLVLDTTSLPRTGARGTALELRALQRSASREAGASRERITLDYQVFLAPREVRTLEMPTLTLRYEGQPRAQELRFEAWPVTVAPLVPVEVSVRSGLGELRPDHPPPLIDTEPARWRVRAYALVLAALSGYLALVYVGLPWQGARRRPFGRAWRELRPLSKLATQPSALQWRAACRRLHAAFNQSAGEVLFERGVDRFIARRAAFLPLRADILRFLKLSQREFFAESQREGGDAAWLVEFCRRCRDAERGS